MPAITSITNIGANTWRFSWTPTTPPYRIVCRGLTVATGITVAYYDYAVVPPGTAAPATSPTGYIGDPPASSTPDADPPVLEVLDPTETAAASELYPPYAVVQWRGYPWAVSYVVERLDGATWVKAATVPERGLGYYCHVADALGDTAVVQYRVTAYDGAGNAADPVYLTARAVCPPDAPKTALAYSNTTHNLTVSLR